MATLQRELPGDWLCADVLVKNTFLHTGLTGDMQPDSPVVLSRSRTCPAETPHQALCRPLVLRGPPLRPELTTWLGIACIEDQDQEQEFSESSASQPRSLGGEEVLKIQQVSGLSKDVEVTIPQQADRGYPAGPRSDAGESISSYGAATSTAATVTSRPSGFDQPQSPWKSSRQRGPVPAGPQRKGSQVGRPLHRELPVGMEDSRHFRVVKRLIGKNGENMKSIAQLCPGTGVELRGAGTNPWSGDQPGPLTMHVRGRNPEHFKLAVQLAEKLIRDIQEDYRRSHESRQAKPHQDRKERGNKKDASLN
eukprot:TRINITY_DN111953_c0_g1_i1.p1 TRINITY_DN111953_c0_g1~~TRINITY_DN111953_c0_g1_i1.p1  ORF type:complete len:308 (-),score=41.87 TRINITY_DN111953_c0_g1_i1:286-1209(-)